MRTDLLLLVAFFAVGGARAAEPEAARIDRLVRQLSSEKFVEREDAAKRLQGIGEPALPALEKAIDGGDLEARLRAEEIRETIITRLQASLPADVRRLGGSVRVVEEQYPGPVVRVAVILSGTRVADSDVARLRWLEGLRDLDLSDTGVTDAGLCRLAGWRGLRKLNLASRAHSILI